MKKSVFILIVFALSLQVNAQIYLPEGPDTSQREPSVEKKVNYTLSTGASFYSSRGNASGSSFFIAPEFTVKLSPRFKVNAGIMLMQNRFNYSPPTSLFGEKSVVVKSGPSYDGVLYASGIYSFNSRLTFSGSIVKSFSPGGSSSSDLAWQNSFQVMSLGVNYKLTDNISIGGGVRMIQSNGYNPYTGYNYLSPGLGFNPVNSFTEPLR